MTFWDAFRRHRDTSATAFPSEIGLLTTIPRISVKLQPNNDAPGSHRVLERKLALFERLAGNRQPHVMFTNAITLKKLPCHLRTPP
jgi:hypothetical protein